MTVVQAVTAKDVAGALEAVEEARDQYRLADEAYREASRARNAAQNHLDEKVKEYNTAVRAFGTTIPRECSYWEHPESGARRGE